ncbi:MAG: indolepyruvate oxidoreductase subunit beta [Kiritimatiellae bacterium]|nr:indolepyruvate oxidoreductase subunit beta [Kiritimatiellia bacterium]
MSTFNVSLVGVGGQGILLTANLLGRVAALAGLDVKKSEIHGMAQRGGSVASSVRFGERVHSPIIPAGESDLLVAFDRLEALRCASQLKAGGKVLVNDVYLTPVTVSSGQQPEVADLAGSLAKVLPEAIYVDAAGIAKEVGNDRTANMVLAGALSALTPFPEELWHKAMAETFTGPKAKLLEMNEKAFAKGRAAAMA